MKTWQLLKKNPLLWERYFVREKVLTAIRRFFFDRGFHEVETPLLTGSLPPESYLEVFETTLLSSTRQKTRAFLPTSPEPFLKKLLVAGIGNCFSLTKTFRNTELQSPIHSPEFTMLEWYRSNATYMDIMDDCEELIVFIHTYLQRSVNKKEGAQSTNKLQYQGKTIDLTPPWERLTVSEAFHKYAGIDLSSVLTLPTLKAAAVKKGYQVSEGDSWEELFNQIVLNEIDPHLGRGKPTILYDYPAQPRIAALARRKPTDPRFAERFEFYIEGMELGDAYGELTDPVEQQERFTEELKSKQELGKTIHPIDTDFLSALKEGMPESGGIAVGVDRLIMLFTDVTNIADTLFFPRNDLFE